jgi:hypothetical protein
MVNTDEMSETNRTDDTGTMKRNRRLAEFDRAIRVGGSCPTCADRPALSAS